MDEAKKNVTHWVKLTQKKKIFTSNNFIGFIFLTTFVISATLTKHESMAVYLMVMVVGTYSLSQIISRPLLKKRFSPLIKRTFDILVSSIALILLSPLFIWVAFKVRMTGPIVLFSHDRVGRGGKTFKCLKFRSMVPDAQNKLEEYLKENPNVKKEWDKNRKLKNDPRITPFGHFIRSCSLDELPQFFNVIKGDMSLVGPRPVPEEELNAMYGKAKKHYLKSKPGITGLWQVSGRNDTDYSERISMDRWYASQSSIISDIGILFKTVFVVLKRKGSY